MRLKGQIHTAESEAELKSLYPSDIMKRCHAAHGDVGLPSGELDVEKRVFPQELSSQKDVAEM